MFKNYLKIALRNLTKNKTTSFINIAGLAIGIAFSLLVYLFVHDEYSFDRFHEDSNRIYRVWTQSFTPEWGTNNIGSMPIRIADDFRRLYPEIDHVVRISHRESKIRISELVYKEKLTFVDPAIFL